MAEEQRCLQIVKMGTGLRRAPDARALCDALGGGARCSGGERPTAQVRLELVIEQNARKAESANNMETYFYDTRRKIVQYKR